MVNIWKPTFKQNNWNNHRQHEPSVLSGYDMWLHFFLDVTYSISLYFNLHSNWPFKKKCRKQICMQIYNLQKEIKCPINLWEVSAHGLTKVFIFPVRDEPRKPILFSDHCSNYLLFCSFAYYICQIKTTWMLNLSLKLFEQTI